MIRAMGNSAAGRPSAPYTDPQFARNYAECKRLGIPCGVYGYFKAVNREQADKELAYFKKLLTGRSFELPVAVDIEDEVQKPLGKAALTDLTTYMLSTVESWGVYALLYTGLWFGSTFLYMGGAALKPYDVWLAAYRARKPAPAGRLACGSTPVRRISRALRMPFRTRPPMWTCPTHTRTMQGSSARRA